MPNRRLVEGVFRTPDGIIWADRSLTWYRQPRKTRAQGGAVVLDEPFVVTTDGAGEMSQEMEPGAYLVLVRLGDVDRYFEVGVPEGAGSFDVADGVAAAAPFITPSAVQQALEARDLARRWATEDADVPVETAPDRFSARHWAVRAQDAAQAAEDFAGSRVDTFAELAAVAPGDLEVGAFIRVIETGAVYRRVSSDGDLDYTAAGGVQLDVVGEIRPEMFPTIEAAILAASGTGRALRGTPGQTYTFADGVTVSGPLIADFSGCFLVRAASAPNVPAIAVSHPFSAATFGAADDVTAYALAEFDYGNGATFVPRITVADTGAYAVGQIVKVLSSDRIPCIAPWEDTRHAEMGEIGAIDAGNGHLYLIRPFCETWTPEKIVRLTALSVVLRGGEWSDAPGYPAGRNEPMLRLRGCVRPSVSGVTLRDTAGAQLVLESCHEPRSLGNRFERPRQSPANGAFAYGEKHIGCTRPVQQNAVGTSCRHVFDTGGTVVADADLSTAPVHRFGGVMEARVIGGVGHDSLNAPFGDHPDACDTQIIDCASLWVNRGGAGSPLFGLQLRGRRSSAKGGVYSGLQPLQIEPSTGAPCLVDGVTFIKEAPTDDDAARQALGEIDGAGVIGGGKARVKFRNVIMRQARSRKEMLRLENAEVAFDGTIDYAATLSNFVFARLEAASRLVIHGLDGDFSQATAPTPMLTSLADAPSSVFAPGRVTIRNSPAASSFIVLTDYNGGAGAADWRDVMGDGPFFGNDSGWRNAGSAGLRRALVQRSDSGARNNSLAVNFSAGGGPKPISWPVGTGNALIHAAINPTTTNTHVGATPDGVFAGQILVLYNVGAFAFEIQSGGNIAVIATRTVDPGSTAMLRWDGTNWTG